MTLAKAIREATRPFPRLQAALAALARRWRRGPPAGYTELGLQVREAEAEHLRDAWRSDALPDRQRIEVDRGLAAYRAGEGSRAFDVLVDMVRGAVEELRGTEEDVSLLEVGCSSGYHAEVLTIKGVSVRYAGCDYSPAFIDLARRYYPTLDFRVADATALAYDDASFDVVVSGCCLLHIPDYEAAIRETARVTRTYALFHRTPVLHRAPTKYFTKRAYGVPTVEIHFNEEELVGLFAKHGLAVVRVVTLEASWRGGDAYATKSYLCLRMPPRQGRGQPPA